MMDRITIRKSLAKRIEIDPFFKRMMTGSEKWNTYDNIARKQSWSKRGPNTKFKSLLSTTGPLEANNWPELANRRGVVFHQDNATPHTSEVIRQKLLELGWEILMHPPYSPDLAPNGYQLFLALQNFLSDKKLGSREGCENRLLEFFANKGQDFNERGNIKIPLK
ncbi:histone-lysine N-methyltransferase SETMAR [Trichonephila clavipes]|uniref:Histone-lysine N-methyltransferase SETMAR n=1 Tax=Trichonephila clavipes TaxID=2585209 RepID=A0A8X6S2U6_TRICX|nr:histone-lysine N-methyltransferase SETMAR [Trichonephila clavipes]